jgi:hypothetical protein
MKTRIVLASLLTLCLAIPTLPARAFSLPRSSQQPTQGQQQIEEAKARARRMMKAVSQVRKLLREAGVPFEPLTLFRSRWRQRLAPIFESMPEMRANKTQVAALSGVHLANTLHLPNRVELAGDTVILAKHIIFQGRDVLIKGSHSIHIFAVNSVRKTDNTGGSITIDTSGRGKKEWLESTKDKQSLRPAPRVPFAQGMTFKWAASPFSAFVHPVSFASSLADLNGAPGARGTDGQLGADGLIGQEGTKGADGSCFGSLDGEIGWFGGDGGDGANGGDAGNGSPGENGHGDTLTITDPADDTQYNFVTNGGAGGDGGTGGNGGRGGGGGKGGGGGDGAGCQCVPGGLGKGGNGGLGGRGGKGSNGGKGGNGGNGGNGGWITVNYPAGYNRSNVQVTAEGGNPGTGGQGGIAGVGGLGGEGGEGGKGGSIAGCGTSNHGGDGGPGDNGGGNFSSGASGQNGNRGTDGGINWNETGGEGGGGEEGPFLEPGAGEEDGYVCWYLVWYSCPCGDFYCCYEVHRELVGCFSLEQ